MTGSLVSQTATRHQHRDLIANEACLPAGVQYVAAPVFGRPDAVLAKKIVNVIAGAARDRSWPVNGISCCSDEDTVVQTLPYVSMIVSMMIMVFCSEACYVSNSMRSGWLCIARTALQFIDRQSRCVIAGPPAAKARVKPLLEHMGRGVMGARLTPCI